MSRDWSTGGGKRTAGLVFGVLCWLIGPPVLGAPVSEEEIQNINVAAQRIMGMHDRVFRDHKTFRRLLQRSYTIDLCAFNDTGVKHTHPLGFGLGFYFGLGYGSYIPENGTPAEGDLRKGAGFTGSAKFKGHGIHWVCAKLGALGNHLEVKVPYNITDTEEPYELIEPHQFPMKIHTMPGEVESAEPRGTAFQTRSIDDMIDGVSAPEVLNLIIGNYLAQGLDPGNADHVRLLLLGVDPDELIDSAGSIAEKPVEGLLLGFDHVAGLFDIIPLSGVFSSLIDAFREIDSVPNPCSVMDGFESYCDEAEYIVGMIRDADSLIRIFPGIEDLFISKVSEIENTVDDAISKLTWFTDEIVAFTQFVQNGVLHGAYWPARNLANNMYNKIGTLVAPLEGLEDTMDSFIFEKCKNFKSSRTISTSGWYGEVHCRFGVNLRPCGTTEWSYVLACATSSGSLPNAPSVSLSSDVLDLWFLYDSLKSFICAKTGVPTFNPWGICD